MNNLSYLVKIAQFEGPIAVLYSLIEERKLSVNELGLSEITDSFLTFLNELKNADEGADIKSEMAQFIHIGAMLILLKSKTLLPEIEVTEEEERDLSVLENQLKAYALLKEAVKHLKKDHQINAGFKRSFIAPKVKYTKLTKVFIPDPNINIDSFAGYLLERLEHLSPEQVKLEEVKVEKKIKIEDALSHVRNVIKRLKTLSFKNMHSATGGDDRLKEKTKKTLVILFLAILELVKSGEIEVEQENNFDDITIVSTENNYEEIQ